MGRAISYVSLVNTGMILVLFLSKVQESGYVGFDIEKWAILLYIIGIVGSVFIGWIDVKMGLYKYENSVNWQQIPEIVEILERLKKIEDKLK